MGTGTRKQSAGGAIEVSGRLASWVRDGELDGRPLVLLSHGAGAPYTSPFMVAVAQGLVARGAVVVRFHFPYMERLALEGRRSAPDRPPVLLATIRGMLGEIGGWSGATQSPIIFSGKSMGGRMMSMLLAEGTPPGVQGAVYLGYPLSPAGHPEKTRAEHLASVAVPQLFISGSRDSLCDLGRLRAVLRPIGPSARLHVVEGGDHSLATSRKEPMLGSDAWLDVMWKFIVEVTA